MRRVAAGTAVRGRTQAGDDMGKKVVLEMEIDQELAAKIAGQPPITLESLKQLGDMMTSVLATTPQLQAACKVRYFERESGPDASG